MNIDRFIADLENYIARSEMLVAQQCNLLEFLKASTLPYQSAQQFLDGLVDQLRQQYAHRARLLEAAERSRLCNPSPALR